MKMTDFNPASDGFCFANTFTNDFVREFDIKTHGLCGGMAYSALDYYLKHKPIPKQDYRPAVHTTLHDYIYDRQVHSTADNIDKWAELRLNPGGVRNSEFFNWGLQGFNGGRLQELRESIDKGIPIPLGLKSYGGNEGVKERSGDHQVLAIGYDLGRYRGDLGANKEDLKIFIYDSNHPKKTRILVPDLSTGSYYYWDDLTSTDTKVHRWRTYFVDKKYRAHEPPIIASSTPTPSGYVRELLLCIKTGGDDLRGGNDNLNITVYVTGETPQTFNNVNGSRRWISNYEQMVSIVLSKTVRVSDISKIEFTTTFSGGLSGDNWNMDSLKVNYHSGGISYNIYNAIGGPLFRFTGDRKNFTIHIKVIDTQLRGTYTLQQKSNGLYMDAHEGSNNNSVVTRDRQNNDSQAWILTPLGNNTHTLQQKSNGLFMDAYEGSNDNSVVTRDRQNNDSQLWILMTLGDNTYTLQQKSTKQYLDAHEGRNDNSVVTRDMQDNNTQRWIIKPL